MQVKFHGAKGSHPVSATPARVHEILKSTWEFAQKNPCKNFEEFFEKLNAEPRATYQIWGGNTTCVELKSDLAPMPVFFDAGTGLTQAGMDPDSGLNTDPFRKGTGKVAVFFSHTHWDHLIGLITIEQLFKGNEFHFYGVHKNLPDRIQTLFQEKHFPVPYHVMEPHFVYHQIQLNTPIQLGGLSIAHYPQTHPGGSFAYRVYDGKKTLVFATDTELKNIDPPHMTPGSNVYSGADVLILDAQFSPEEFPAKQGFGHSQIFSAVDFAVREETRRLYLFHQSPFYSDSQIDDQLIRARQYKDKKYGKAHSLEIFMAAEGEEITV